MVRISGIVSVIKSLSKLHEQKAVKFLPDALPISFGSEVSGSVKETLKLQDGAKFFDYPEILQQEVRHLSESLPKNMNSFLQNLVLHNNNSEFVAKLVRNPESFKKYILVKNALNKIFASVPNQNKELILENMAMMRLFNSNSFKVLTRSKGLKEIQKGNLSFEYIANITPNTKIDEDYFYNLFDKIEKATNARLLNIKGLDNNLAAKLIKASDEKICKNPQVLVDILTEFEKSGNIELTNKILSKFETSMNESSDVIMDILKKSKDNPKLVSKLLDMENLYPGNLKYMLETVTSKTGECKISESALDYFINFQRQNKDICPPYMLSSVNRFLDVTNGDEKLMKEIIEKYLDAKPKNVDLDTIFWTVSGNNIEYLKYNMKNGKFNEELMEKLSISTESESFKDPKNWKIIDRIYDETYLPYKKVFAGSKVDSEVNAPKTIACLQIHEPEMYKKLEDLGILELIKSKRIPPRILNGYYAGRDFTPEIYADLKMLKNNESLVKRFDNFDKILTKTTSGDVVSVNGKLYVNNDGKLERWNMTEEKFNDLFPLVDRYTTSQGLDDCYLISALDGIYRNPKSRGLYYKMFEQKGNDIYVTIPAYKDYKGTVKFPDGQIKTINLNAEGAKHIQMLEQAYSRTALRISKDAPIGKDPLTTDDLFYLQRRISSGYIDNVMREFLLFNNKLQRKKLSRKICPYILSNDSDLEAIKRNFAKYGTDPKMIFNIGWLKPGSQNGHALSVRAYNPETKKLVIVNPNCTAVEYETTVDELGKNLYSVYTTILK